MGFETKLQRNQWSRRSGKIRTNLSFHFPCGGAARKYGGAGRTREDVQKLK